VLAGGTFLGILMNQRFVSPAALLGLGGVTELERIEAAGGELRLGAMVTHRRVELDPETEAWPALRRAFGLVASPRVRNQATVGGVLADADYASDPPAMFAALGARAVLRSAGGDREVAIDELILGHYETCIAPDELLTEVRVPPQPAAVYRKFRSRSAEDRPCVAVAAARGDDGLRVVVGAVAGTPQSFPDACADGAPAEEVGRRYAERIEPIADARGSAAYRRRVIAVEVRRAVEALA
jgi:aerobic carbon-monoxide dehydrogenase medium subunit